MALYKRSNSQSCYPPQTDKAAKGNNLDRFLIAKT
jgi:hypothetical protein